ncbi:lactate racemase domain-containing protein [Halanaerobium sp. MA284_MarDTE_T2]|uniref:lactate racemase domain-containing protein n=1 Tax=Halanaerobium sp. MA284_MarDTE_T2 TaxID=2183913 RepID=UPI000DF1C280|nr:lactate racemase domain-containing protein [Halanaerobium sp. MA284_MarDTE_T2]
MKKIKMRKITQSFNNEFIDDIPAEIRKEFEKINFDKIIKPGMKICITVGSRGIDNIKSIIKSVIQEVKKRKGVPFITPSMGSHGGAYAEGQLAILAKYGITEKEMGVPIEATMDVIKLGEIENGLPVYFDKIAYESDGIIAVNRVKVHTGFKSEIESGLHKILAVGLGNHKGAKLVHSLGVDGLRNYIVEFAKVILKKAPVVCGLAILENAYDKTFKLKAARPESFWEVDTELLQECKNLFPSLPVKDIDLLIIKEMGKNISGTGIDTNIIGGIMGPVEEFNLPQIKKIMVLDLTPETQGNAMGIGIADLITEKLFNKINYKSTYANAITSTFFERARIPMVFKTEKEGIEAALEAIWNLPGEKPRIIIMKNTLDLENLYVSEVIWDEIKENIEIKSENDWENIKYDQEGNLVMKYILN